MVDEMNQMEYLLAFHQLPSYSYKKCIPKSLSTQDRKTLHFKKYIEKEPLFT